MKYNQPFGISDPNAAYINGNPSTGTMGSIPPAASIEYPQREIANLISDAAITPDNADLRQLAKAVQSGKLIYADDVGVVNQISLNCTPVLLGLRKGMTFVTKVAVTNTGPTTATINGITAPIVHSNDFTPLLAFDVNSGQMVALAYDGTNFQLVWSSSGLRTAQGVLQANYDFYVNGTTGNDTTYDGTQDTVGVAGHGPFKTIMKAATSASKLNANGYVITVHVANGTYPESVFITFQTNGLLRFMGNPASPASCVVTGSPTQPNGACFQARGTGVGFWVEGFKVLPSHPSGTYGFVSQINSSIDFQNIDFGAAGAGHMLCDTGSMACNGDYTISGAAQFHIAVEFATFVLTPNRVPPTVNSIVNITAGFNFSQAFVFGWGNGFLRCDSRTIFSGAAGSVTGQRFNVSANATIYTSGAGVNFFPGNVAGVTATGGQYV